MGGVITCMKGACTCNLAPPHYLFESMFAPRRYSQLLSYVTNALNFENQIGLLS